MSGDRYRIAERGDGRFTLDGLFSGDWKTIESYSREAEAVAAFREFLASIRKAQPGRTIRRIVADEKVGGEDGRR